MNFVNRFWGHFKTVWLHRRWVRHYCFKCGLYWQGITHDLSKYSPVEFWESVKYFEGIRSPIDHCKEVNGWSKAWMHHKGRNKHHYEYWQDKFDFGGEPLFMPKKYEVEMLCDFLGAGRAYSQNKKIPFTYDSELIWWKNKTSHGIKMHPDTKKHINDWLIALYNCKNKEEEKEFFRTIKKYVKNKEMSCLDSMCRS